jgi:CheY-specific phosphatase CheX
MDKINSLDIKTFITHAINNVFETMLSINVEVFDEDLPAIEDGGRFRVSIQITGEAKGNLDIQISESFARLVTASMQDIAVEEIESDQEVEDAIRELSSMIAGSLQANLRDSGLSCELSILSVTTGSDFESETFDMMRNERLGFRHEQHVAMVEMHMKRDDSVDKKEDEEKTQAADEGAETEKVEADTQDSGQEKTLGDAADEDGAEEEAQTEKADAVEELPRFEAVGDHEKTDPEQTEWEDAVESELSKKDRKFRSTVGRALAMVVIFACFMGLLLRFYGKKEKQETLRLLPAPTPQAGQIEKPNLKPVSPLQERLEKVAVLREELRQKQKDIARLKRHYQKGIEVENEILREIREKGVNSYQEAIKDKKIELALRTIQRRQAYIEQLDQPYERLHRSNEELHYLERLTRIQSQMANFTTGIDVNELIERIDRGILQHGLGADKLFFDTKGVNLQSLESIWKKKSTEIEKPRIAKALSPEEERNQEIWQEICDGIFNRKNELTELSPEAAKCLSRWKGKELYLNALSQLSPELAKNLSQWKGNWLSLNGLTELSPELAKDLSQWQGRLLSLNGLAELSPVAAKYLCQWQGKQLELMGLKRLARRQGRESELIGFKYLLDWEKSGGKLFVSEDFKKQYE